MVRVLAVLFAVLAVPALAAESAAVRTARTVASLVSDSDSVVAGRPLHLALRLRLAPGWHTYWRNPGDAGVAPEVAWSGLETAGTVGPIAWPTPERLREGPLMAYGYTGEVLLPVEVVPVVVPGAGGLDVTATASWLACERVCVPEEGVFRLSLPAGGASASAEAPLFAAAVARTPRTSPFEARVAADGTLTLAGAGLSPASVRDAWFFPDAPDLVVAAATQAVRVEDGTVRLGLSPAAGFDAGVQGGAGLTGVLVLRDAGGQETALQVTAAPGGVPGGVSDEAGVPIWRAVLLALAGGLLLNLMPCVFPVLAIKALGLARLSGQERRAVRWEAGSYTAGVLVAFAGLGGVLLAARALGGAAGAAVGWGFQFQSPAFVAVTAWVLFLVGLNLSGVFAVGGGRLAGAGEGLARRGGHAGSFFTGLLAVVVASPCTAPFMGAALAAALSGPVWAGLLVFGAMGVGLAAPYAVLGLVPSLARGLPRPGPWMAVAKGALAFPMYGAAAWLVWVVSVEAGPSGVLAALAGLVLLGFAAWLVGLAQVSGRRPGYLGAAVAAVLAVVLLPGMAPSAGAMPLPDGVEAFTPARLEALRREGRPVFVNMTAAWCVTCLVNERVALSSERVRQAFAAHKVAYLKGDWTRGDPAITAFLRAQGRDGVPLYVLYPAKQGRPVVLPQILTEGELVARLGGVGL